MKEAKINECACIVLCVQFHYLLKAWDRQRKLWHTVACKCTGCTGPRFDSYMAASKSLTLFRAKICCAREERPHLKLPQFPDETLEFYKLGCCKRSQKMPSHVQACDHCGWQKKFYNVHDCVERTDGIAKWMQWESTDSTGKTNTRPVLREHTGTCTHERENKNKKYLPCFVIVILGPVFVVLSLFRRYSSRINKCHQASLSCDVVSLLGERNVQTSETSIHPGNGCMCVL